MVIDEYYCEMRETILVFEKKINYKIKLSLIYY